MYWIDQFEMNGADWVDKITILSKTRDNQEIFFAKFINTKLDLYTSLDELEQKHYYGIHITDGNQNVVCSNDVKSLKENILANHRKVLLTSDLKYPLNSF